MKTNSMIVMDDGSIMNRNNIGTSSNYQTKKRGLLTLKAVSCVPSKRRRRFDESAVSSEDEVSPVTIPRSLHFLSLLVGTRVASRVPSSAHHSLSCQYVPSTFSPSTTKTEATDNHNDLIQRFNLQVKRGIHDASSDGSDSVSMESRPIMQAWLMNGVETDTSNAQLCREAFWDILSWIKMMDETVQEDFVQSKNLTRLLLAYLHHPSRNVTCFVMDMLRYLAGSSKHLRQKMSSQLELILSILRILKENIFDSCKQQLGISIMSWLVEEESCRAIMIKEGCIQHLFHVMDIYQWDDVVQCNATAALCWLMHCSPSSSSSFLITSTSVSEEHSHSTLEHPRQCVVVLLHTMRRFLLDAKVFGNTLSVLSGILLKHPLGALGARPSADTPNLDIVGLTMVGMRFHQVGCPKVQSNGLALLRILLAHHGNDDEEDEAVVLGGDSVIATLLSNLDIIEECMKQYSEEPFIQAEACAILAYLVSSSSSSSSSSTTTTTGVRASIMQSGCIETVIQAQMKHRGDVRLQHYALCFHSGLLRDISSPSAADAFGAGLAVLDTLAAGSIVPIAVTED